MTESSAAPTEVAQLLWERAVGDSTTPEAVAVAAARMCTELRVGLSRWVGAMGYRALINRALLVAAPGHPALRSLSGHEGDEVADITGVRAFSAADVAAAMVALLAALVELLGRIVGEEMAVRLVEQTVQQGKQTGLRLEPTGIQERESARASGERSRDRERPSPGGAVSTKSKGERDAGLD
jgi:hypothetical protein